MNQPIKDGLRDRRLKTNFNSTIKAKKKKRKNQLQKDLNSKENIYFS